MAMTPDEKRRRERERKAKQRQAAKEKAQLEALPRIGPAGRDAGWTSGGTEAGTPSPRLSNEAAALAFVESLAVPPSAQPHIALLVTLARDLDSDAIAQRYEETMDRLIAASKPVFPLASIKSLDLGGTKTNVGVAPASVLAGSPASSSTDRLGFTSATLPSDTAEKFVAITSNGYSLSATLSTVMLYLGAINSATLNVAPSIAVARMALVDITAGTGLTHGGVAAADLNAWSASMSVGGYYNGDTMSDPAVLVP